MKKFLGFGLAFAVQIITNTQTFADFPKNNLHLEDKRFRRATSMTEEKFNALIDKVNSVYASVFEGHGATLAWERNWDDSTVNAYANQTGTRWQVAMFGGLARRPEVTEDGFVLVMCHEIGHHLAGFPLYGPNEWAASEGQSDYFATQVCAKKMWRDELDINASFRERVNPVAKEACDQIWTETADQNLCYRSSMAGYSLADLLAKIGDSNAQVSFSTPSVAVVEQTSVAHPAAQCRLDTYWAGALCDKVIPDNVIPGKTELTTEDPEAIATQYSCMSADFYFQGIRPLCWFHPTKPAMVSLNDFLMEALAGNSNGAVDPGESFSLRAKLQNNSSADLSNIQLKLSSSMSGVTVTSSDALLASLASQTASSDQDNPFAVTFGSELACGSSVKLNLAVTLNEHKKGNLSYSTILGTKVTSDLAQNDTEFAIEDLGTVISSLEVAAMGSAATMNITMKIEHTFFKDLRFKVTSPAGKEFKFDAKSPANNGSFELSAKVPVAGEDIAGNWTLTVSDVTARDAGKLFSWSAQFEKYICE